MMEERNTGMTEEQYLEWLETLARKEPSSSRRAGMIPGVLVESARGNAAAYWAERFFAPLRRLGLLSFQGESPWIEMTGSSWERLDRAPEQLARHMLTAAGLHGRFRGGVVIDLRWCQGEPLPGQLRTLERFLFEMAEDLRPLLLTQQGIGEAVCAQLGMLDIQRIRPREAEITALTEELRRNNQLTQGGRALALRRMEQGSEENAAAVLRAVRRLTAMAGEPVDEQRLLDCLGPEPRRQERQIGFGRSMEYERD